MREDTGTDGCGATREMAIGNTFGATALSSYGGFWISFAIILTPGGFEIVQSLGGENAQFINSFGFFLMVCVTSILLAHNAIKRSDPNMSPIRDGSSLPFSSSSAPFDPPSPSSRSSYLWI